MAKPRKVPRTPEDLVRAIRAAGFKVDRRTHGWLIFPGDRARPAEWISRNAGDRGQRNNLAVAKHFINL